MNLVVRTFSSSAADSTIGSGRLFPYSVLPLPAMNRAVSTTTDMDEADTVATAKWVQIWRLSDLTLLRTIALPPGPRGNENQYTGESRLLEDGRSITSTRSTAVSTCCATSRASTRRRAS